MEPDLYTKVVLTIIAAALTAIAVQGFVPTARAQYTGGVGSPAHVVIDSVQYGAFSYSGSVPVKIMQN